MVEIAEKNSKQRKKRSLWKSNRLLMKAKKMVQRKLRETSLGKEEINLLKRRKRLIIEHMNDEDKKRHYQKLSKIVDTVKKGGGVDSTSFWDLRRKLVPQK